MNCKKCLRYSCVCKKKAEGSSTPLVTNEGNLNLPIGGGIGISSDGDVTVGGVEISSGSDSSSFDSGGGDFGGGGSSGDY